MLRLNAPTVAGGATLSAAFMTGMLVDLGPVSPDAGFWGVLVVGSFALPAWIARLGLERRRTPWSKDWVSPQVKFAVVTTILSAAVCWLAAVAIFELAPSPRVSPLEALALVGGGALIAAVAGALRSRQPW